MGEHTIDHIVWECPCFIETRREASPAIHTIDFATIPKMVERGIAPAMTVSPD